MFGCQDDGTSLCWVDIIIIIDLHLPFGSRKFVWWEINVLGYLFLLKF